MKKMMMSMAEMRELAKESQLMLREAQKRRALLLKIAILREKLNTMVSSIL